MGMFDTIRSSYDLGPGFYNKELQTKDLDNLCETFWLDPAGRLYKIDYAGTQDWIKTPEDEVKNPFDLYRTVPNGQHGKVTPYIMNGTIEVVPSRWEAYYASVPRKLVTFVDGVVSVESDRSETVWKDRYYSLKRWVKDRYEA